MTSIPTVGQIWHSKAGDFPVKVHSILAVEDRMVQVVFGHHDGCARYQCDDFASFLETYYLVWCPFGQHEVPPVTAAPNETIFTPKQMSTLVRSDVTVVLDD